MLHSSLNDVPYATFGSRDVVIIDGQPYYKSTGKNSGAQGTWLPFVMIVGTEIAKTKNKLIFPNELQHDYHLPNKPADVNYSIELFFYDSREGHDNKRILIKAELDVLNPNFKGSNQIKPVLLDGRICTKKDLINSIRLGGGMWDDGGVKHKALSLLNDEERKLAKKPIKIMSKAAIRTNDPDVLNNWLLSNGATTINKLFDLNEIPKPLSTDTVVDTKIAKLRCMLEEYVELRQDEQNSFFHSIFSSFGEHDFVTKKYAAESLKKWLDGKHVTITQDQLSALNKGHLGKIFAEIKKTEYYKNHRNNLSVKIPEANPGLKHMGRKY